MTGPREPPRLLAGRPGSGKTTAIARLVELPRAYGLVGAAFSRASCAERGQRVGFTLETLDADAARSRTFGSAV